MTASKLIAALAARGLTAGPDIIRYAQRIGRIPPSARDSAGHCIFTNRHILAMAAYLTAPRRRTYLTAPCRRSGLQGRKLAQHELATRLLHQGKSQRYVARTTALARATIRRIVADQKPAKLGAQETNHTILNTKGVTMSSQVAILVASWIAQNSAVVNNPDKTFNDVRAVASAAINMNVSSQMFSRCLTALGYDVAAIRKRRRSHPSVSGNRPLGARLESTRLAYLVDYTNWLTHVVTKLATALDVDVSGIARPNDELLKNITRISNVDSSATE
jgi:hypothetical protein